MTILEAAFSQYRPVYCSLLWSLVLMNCCCQQLGVKINLGNIFVSWSFDFPPDDFYFRPIYPIASSSLQAINFLEELTSHILGLKVEVSVALMKCWLPRSRVTIPTAPALLGQPLRELWLSSHLIVYQVCLTVEHEEPLRNQPDDVLLTQTPNQLRLLDLWWHHQKNPSVLSTVTLRSFKRGTESMGGESCVCETS